MPISKINRLRYPQNWKQISEHIRFVRAGNKCEVCGIENGKDGWRVKDGTFYTAEEFSSMYLDHKHDTELCQLVEHKSPIRIVLTVAHLNHIVEDCSDENLAALCQRCHNRHDVDHRKVNARTTREQKKGQTTLFQ